MWIYFLILKEEEWQSVNMCFTVIKITGIVLASLAILASICTEGFYAWKIYEIENECDEPPVTTDATPVTDNGTTTSPTEPSSLPDVCIFDELRVRTYIGLGEGIAGTLVSIGFLIGFAMPSVPLIWVWVVWALGIASYNSYCIGDYAQTIKDQQGVEDFPWDTFIDEDYGEFFVLVMTSVIWYGTALLITIPMAAYLSYAIRTDGSFTGGFELQQR